MALGGVRGLTDQSVSTAHVDDAVDYIQDEVGAILTLQETGGSITTDGTEQNLYIVNNPAAGSMKPLHAFVDLDAMVGGDTVTFKTYYRIEVSGGWEVQNVETYIGVDGGLMDGRKLIAIELLPCRFGIRLTVQRTAGVDHAYIYSVMEES